MKVVEQITPNLHENARKVLTQNAMDGCDDGIPFKSDKKASLIASTVSDGMALADTNDTLTEGFGPS